MGTWRGRKPQGGTVTLAVVCRSSSGSPAAPDACPAVDVYGPAGRAAAAGVLVPAADPAAAPGLFALDLFLDARFPPGAYVAAYRWTAGGFFGMAVDFFEVTPGGSADGPVVGLRHHERPQADFVVQQTAGGAFRRGKNPRL